MEPEDGSFSKKKLPSGCLPILTEMRCSAWEILGSAKPIWRKSVIHAIVYSLPRM
jgi:hypothetical protein